VALVKEHCTAMALRDFVPMPQGGSRKGGTFEAWFSELAKKELGFIPAEELLSDPLYARRS
jgi:hypothetical protein